MSVMIQNILQQVMINNHNARSKVDNQRKEKEKIIDIIIHDILVDFVYKYIHVFFDRLLKSNIK